MQIRKLGSNGPDVSAIGLGCMSFAGAFGETDEATSLQCLDAAYEKGITFLDTANVYGMGRSEKILATWMASRKPDVVVATKAGIIRDPDRPANNEPDYLRAELDASLQRLGVDYVDLFYLHRRDRTVPLEDAIGALVRLEEEGKIGGYGLSEVAPYTIRRAHEIHPCTAVQNEYSLWSRQPEMGVIQTCADLGIAFVPFSPIARGMFGRGYPDPATMADRDIRKPMPRFSPENFARNTAIIDEFKTLAADRGFTSSALALAWVLDRGDHLLPIPATRTAEHLNDWADACELPLDADLKAEIDRILPVGFAFGDRYTDAQARSAERYC